MKQGNVVSVRAGAGRGSGDPGGQWVWARRRGGQFARRSWSQPRPNRPNQGEAGVGRTPAPQLEVIRGVAP